MTPTNELEHLLIAKRALIEAHFPGLGGALPPRVDEVTRALFHEVRLSQRGTDDLTPDWSGKTAEEVYRYYEFYALMKGELPNFKDVMLKSSELKDVPGVTEFELKMFRHDTPEDTDHMLELLRVSGYICALSGPCYDMAVLALAHLFDTASIDEVMHRLRLDGRAYEMTPEEMEKIIEEHAYMFDSWLTPPAPASSSSSSAPVSVPAKNHDVPIVELD